MQLIHGQGYGADTPRSRKSRVGLHSGQVTPYENNSVYESSNDQTRRPSSISGYSTAESGASIESGFLSETALKLSHVIQRETRRRSRVSVSVQGSLRRISSSSTYPSESPRGSIHGFTPSRIISIPKIPCRTPHTSVLIHRHDGTPNIPLHSHQQDGGPRTASMKSSLAEGFLPTSPVFLPPTEEEKIRRASANLGGLMAKKVTNVSPAASVDSYASKSLPTNQLSSGSPPTNQLLATAPPSAPDAEQLSCFGRYRRAIWNFFDDPHSSKAAYYCSICIFAFIMVSTTIFIMQTEPSAQAHLAKEMNSLENLCAGVFTIEFVTRILSCPSLVKFVTSYSNWIDGAAIFPFYLELFLNVENASSFGAIRVVRLARVARVLKMSRYSSAIQVFVQAISISIKPLSMLLFLMAIVTIVFSSAIYFAEYTSDGCRRNGWVDCDDPTSESCRCDDPNPYTSISASFWWSIVTMSTVGYGDMVPVTVAGKLIGTATLLTGMLVLALPITVIGNNFQKVMKSVMRQTVKNNVDYLRGKRQLCREEIKDILAAFHVVSEDVTLSIEDIISVYDRNSNGMLEDNELARFREDLETLQRNALLNNDFRLGLGTTGGFEAFQLQGYRGVMTPFDLIHETLKPPISEMEQDRSDSLEVSEPPPGPHNQPDAPSSVTTVDTMPSSVPDSPVGSGSAVTPVTPVSRDPSVASVMSTDDASMAPYPHAFACSSMEMADLMAQLDLRMMDLQLQVESRLIELESRVQQRLQHMARFLIRIEEKMDVNNDDD